MLFFPLVGAVIGGAIAGCASALRGVVSHASLSALCVLLLTVSSRGLGLRGIRAVAGSFPGARRDGASTAAIVTVLAGKVGLLAGTAEGFLAYAVFLAAVLGGWAPVVLAHGARPVRADASDALATGRVGSREFAWSSVIAIGLSLVVADALGLVAAITAAVTATGLRLWAYRYHHGMSAALLAAAIELVEGAVLAAVAGASALAGRRY